MEGGFGWCGPALFHLLSLPFRDGQPAQMRSPHGDGTDARGQTYSLKPPCVSQLLIYHWAQTSHSNEVIAVTRKHSQPQ